MNINKSTMSIESSFDNFQKHALDMLKLRDIKERAAFSKKLKESTGKEMVFLYDEAYASDKEDMDYIRETYGEQTFSDNEYDSAEDIDMLSCIMGDEYFCVAFTAEQLNPNHPIPNHTLKYILLVEDNSDRFYMNFIVPHDMAVPKEIMQKYLRIYHSKLRNYNIQDFLES